MKFIRRRIVPVFLLALLCATGAKAQMFEGRELVRAVLLADRTTVVPGQDFRLGILLHLAPGWHVYWRNPGDAGLATTLAWTLPEGFAASPIEWPLPLRIIEPGDLMVFGYKKQVLLPVRISVPAEITETEVTFEVRADWLVCEKICIPGQAEISLTLPVETESHPQNADLFQEALAQQPKPGEPPFAATWNYEDGSWLLHLSGLPAWAEKADFFPYEDQEPEPGHAKAGPLTDGATTLEIAARGSLKGLILLQGAEDRREAWVTTTGELPVVDQKTETATATADPELPAPAATPQFVMPNLWLALFYGMIGGLILNLMPCVLPVISLKIFGFIRQAGESPGRIFRHGLSFTSGIFLWFLGLAVLIVALRAGGEQITWAFQFQNSWFILFIAAVVFVFALNLFGVFEIILPGGATERMSDAAGREGYGGSFFQGIFATLLATPCTAPFLGTALGFAFSQPPAVIFAMFGSVAFGMALPYLLLSARPAWIRFLPKPGGWMEKLKQFMGFPLLATLIWLLSVLGGQKGTGGIIWASSLLLCLGLACWLYGAFCCFNPSARTRWIAGFFALLSAVGGSWFFGSLFAAAERPAPGTTHRADAIPWIPFSAQTMEELLSEDRPVFLDFTADWCITCKFNERTAINTPAVRALIAERGIVPVKADWTNSDPEITEALARFGRVGVPFYVFYPQGNLLPPVTFPELITEAMVLEKLRNEQNE